VDEICRDEMGGTESNLREVWEREGTGKMTWMDGQCCTKY